MSFISYAQNLEDVILYRSLRDVERGFYVDVGAHDPLVDSVTRAFYERGWRGINIEPNGEYLAALERDRPEDINLMTVVGREPGETIFYEVVQTGLSTTNSEYARRHAETGYQVRPHRMPCTTLDAICREHRIETIHFLKIDVEGGEREVLEGFSFAEVRPWVVVAESTEPLSPRDVSQNWEPLIVSRGYEPVYFDGLNRFYLAVEHPELKQRFTSPPNFFDHYVTYHEWWARQHLTAVEKTAEQDRAVLISCLNRLIEETDGLQRTVLELREEIAEEQQHLEGLRERHAAEQRRLASELEQAGADAAERERLLTERHVEEQRQLAARVEQVRADAAQLERVLAEQQGRHSELTARVEQLNGRLMESEHELGRTQNRLRTLRGSISWKVTSPLRELRRGGVRLARLVRRQPRAVAEGVALPASAAEPKVAAQPAVADDPEMERLSEPARVIYRALQEEIARKQ
jgi:FkbM family methyltransferase